MKGHTEDIQQLLREVKENKNQNYTTGLSNLNTTGDFVENIFQWKHGVLEKAEDHEMNSKWKVT